MTWQIQEAKQKFSEVVDLAVKDGPQLVTRRGEEVAVVMSIHEFRKLIGRKPDFKKFLLAAPDLTLERLTELPRDVDL